MSEATTATVNVADLQAALTAAQAKVNEAEAKRTAEGPALFKAGDYDGLDALNQPVKTARAEVTRIERQIESATRESRWAQSAEARKPALDVLNGLIKSRPMAPVQGVRGRITITTEEEQDGDATVQVRRATVTLTPIIEKIDLDAFEQQLAEAIDVAAWDAAKIDDVTVTITDIGGKSTLNMGPTAALNAAGKAAAGTTSDRAGAAEYNFNGSWLGSRAFLEAVEQSGHAFVADNKQSFETALRGTHNGLSNLAKRAAKRMGVESRAKEKASE